MSFRKERAKMTTSLGMAVEGDYQRRQRIKQIRECSCWDRTTSKLGKVALGCFGSVRGRLGHLKNPFKR